MRAVVVACVLMVAAAPAWAEMPNYDVQRHCDKISKVAGAPSQMMLSACFDQEQSAYDALKPRWDSLPQAMRSHCDKIARVAGVGSFMMLNSCVEQEEESARQNAARTFRR